MTGLGAHRLHSVFNHRGVSCGECRDGAVDRRDIRAKRRNKKELRQAA